MAMNKAPFQLLEINVISGQDLAPLSRNMRTYAVAWVHPDRKLSTRVDTRGHTDPTWNDKFVFRVDDQFLQSDTSAVSIEIYALRCFRDVRIGTVRVLVGNLVPSNARNGGSTIRHVGMRFVALQVRRPSGRPQGILNIGVAVLDSSMRSMPLYTVANSAVGYRDLMGEESHTPHHHHHPPPKVQLRRTKSDGTDTINTTDITSQKTINTTDIASQKTSSVVNGSELGISVVGGATPLKVITTTTPTNGSMYTESEIGPPASVVAAGLVADDLFPSAEVGSSILEGWSVEEGGVEGLRSKLEKWRKELPPIYDNGYGHYRRPHRRHTRRHTEMGGGLFSCFGGRFGCECAIFCGPKPKRKKKGGNNDKFQLSPSDSLMLTTPSRLIYPRG
ncbi:uncharacterized protein LOC122668290 [Telopea speciosissima]|uniref:uncharacterized protein LOC122668290 n=1 Tax=Telopea speciosissima TaxID=54955 RepID=UPI001CC7D32A|nr:uncharacterized protein LOC122668290 [Telopea speciosissima]